MTDRPDPGSGSEDEDAPKGSARINGSLFVAIAFMAALGALIVFQVTC